MTSRQQQVYDILLMPIRSRKASTSISRTDGWISSSQRYCYMEDPDMSDFAVGFYEILYGSSLLSGRRMLASDGFVSDVELAGDTMTSFNTLANTILDDPDAKHRSPESVWPEELRVFHQRFCCLANYWVIPMRLGRSGTKLNQYDSADLFLDKVEHELPRLREEQTISYRGYQSENYFRQIQGYGDFCRIHFAEREFEPSELLPLYQSRDGCIEIVRRMTSSIEKRAVRIAETEAVSRLLWDYFSDVGLIA